MVLTSVSDENFSESQDYPPKSPRFPEKSQYLLKSDILKSTIVLFLDSIANSKEIRTSSDKYCFQYKLS